MIVLENYNGTTNAVPVFRIYSDKGVFLHFDGADYTEAFITNQEDVNNYVETDYPIPSPMANANFIYATFLGEYRSITERDILAAKPILKKAIYKLDNDDLYGLFNVLPIWQAGTNYSEYDVIPYEKNIYRVLIPHSSPSETPNISSYYQKVEKPLEFVIEWNERDTPYSIGEKTRVGNNFYESILDNNIWSPTTFPAGWKLLNQGDD